MEQIYNIFFFGIKLQSGSIIVKYGYSLLLKLVVKKYKSQSILTNRKQIQSRLAIRLLKQK